ncbi:DctP family TRAP transporter solute-binding subunit [Microbacterium sp. JB110]|uniref:DctP family TRAP transporter solute-binding subunit n=1 Tax=Microbacterium sp. JB110 TaxID=2024477 RepID=UPI00097F5C36|nr:DctP family TRAP transporter solute-binding subunit [Microbacterium sp. JB110]SJM64294.1 TRAP-type C4-dicarboxylate transport system, periplasmic component [Frigoribacterium sp. JB110]
MNVRTKRAAWVALVGASAVALAGCGSDGGGEAEDGALTLDLATSYNTDQPQHACGAEVIKETVESADVGLNIEIFPSSQLGGDADRISAVASGDIDMDIQGASALGAVYEPISVLDAAYAFDGPEHLAAFMAGDGGQQLVSDFADASGINTLGAWSAGARHFTSNAPINEPSDLAGLRIRFPGSPQFLLNAQALGAQATEIAYEEVYLALQQGTADGQENPITNIDALNLQEVQDYLNLSSHQLNTNLVIIGGVWNELDEDQQAALQEGVENAVDEVTQCVADDETEKIEEWKDSGEWEVNEDVDVAAFQEQAVAWFEAELDGDLLSVFESIRDSAE